MATRPTAAVVNERIDKEVLPAIRSVEVGLTAKLEAQTVELAQKIEDNSLNGLKPTLLELAKQRVQQGIDHQVRHDHIAWLFYWPRRALRGIRNLKVLASLIGFIATLAWAINGVSAVWHLFHR